MNFANTMYVIIALLSIVNLSRTATMLVGSDIYNITEMYKHHKNKNKRAYNPLISIIIPAYNEEAGVIRTLQSVLANSYPKKQIIIVNDGSTDRTKGMLQAFRRKNKGAFTLVNQPNSGKAHALNRAIKFWAKGQLVMVLDADSILQPDAIANMVAHFRNRQVIAAASNVKIISTKKILGVAQRLEYLISYRMKRTLSMLKMEYIVGGVGSTFRRNVLLKVGMYDTDTITEDIDLTVKLIRHFGNKKYRIHYAADSVAYTEHVLTFGALIRQRFRWKYGRFQTFIKNRQMFFNRSRQYTKWLTWYQLPYALVSEFALLLEPLLVGYILYVVLRYGDVTSMLWVYGIVTTYVLFIILGEGSETFFKKIRLSPALPLTYVLMYVLTVVEFAALLKSIGGSRALIRQQQAKNSWEHVERSGGQVII